MTTLIEAIRLKANGVYRYRGSAAKALASLGDKAPRHVRVEGVSNKSQFIDAVGKALAFPDYSAKNWDAFEESLAEVKLADEHGLVIELDRLATFAQNHPEDLETALAILADATEDWQSRGVGFWVLVDGAGSAAQDLAMLTAS